MGWGAAYQFYEDNRSWVESPDEAYEILYGKGDRTALQRSRCPLCHKRFVNRRAVNNHLKDYHAKRINDPQVREWREFLKARED